MPSLPSIVGLTRRGSTESSNQAEGGEQGDPLMPLLFSIGIQQALEEVAAALVPGEQLSAFLDDVYLLCQPARVKPLFKLLERALLRCAGIELHQGKTKTWNRAGVVPDNIGEVRDDAWHPEGITMLGTPVGSEQYISRKMEERVAKERELWSAIPIVPDLQCSWQLLLQSANPRANHTMRTMPPSQSSVCCRAHDEGVWETAKRQLGHVPAEDEEEAGSISTLPMRMGGLGLGSEERCAPAAFWASWADALPMIAERDPAVATEVVDKLPSQEPLHGCLQELREASVLLDMQGFQQRPSWVELCDSKRPPECSARDRGEWPHGWQYWASSISDSRFRKLSMFAGQSAARLAHLRSHSGHNSGCALSHAPTTPEFTIQPHLFQVLLRERLRLPLFLTESTCSGAINRLIRWRATPIERVMARICREAGARVKFNVLLRDMKVRVASSDARRIEVLAQDIPCFGGSQLAVDVTLRSALTRSGEAQPGAAEEDGAILLQARVDKENKYTELLNGRCRLVVVALETGGRWSNEAVDLIWQLAQAKAREVP